MRVARCRNSLLRVLMASPSRSVPLGHLHHSPRATLLLFLSSIVVWSVALALGACHGGSPRGVNAGATTPVPAVASETPPRALFDSLGEVRSPGGHGVPWVRRIVVIAFKRTASQPERQAVVNAINGAVVGSLRLVPVEEYYVRIPGRTFEAIITALIAVRAFGQVDHAAPLMHDPQPDGAR